MKNVEVSFNGGYDFYNLDGVKGTVNLISPSKFEFFVWQ